ncbi:MAG: DsbA family protein [Octadecabacter sp.]|nr:DsbA family protein [Octadecabacter sp.]
MKLVKQALVAVMLVLAPLSALAQDTLSEDRVRELVRETILTNPEILLEAFEILDQRTLAAEASARSDVIGQQRLLLEQDPNAPVLANADGDVTIVEFFDYNCPYCRRVKPTVEDLIEADPGVRIVYREWPILGDGSVFAARAALASREQGLYEEFHWALMGMEGRAEERSVLMVAREVGLDVQQLRFDMEAPEVEEHIETSMRLAELLGVTGTPAFIIGNSLIPGAVGLEVLQQAVGDVRETR